MKTIKVNEEGIAHLLLLGAGLIILLTAVGAWVYTQQSKSPIKLSQDAKTGNSAGTYSELDSKEISEITQSLESENAPAVSPSTATKAPTNKKSPTSAPTAAQTTQSEISAPAPIGVVTISDDGCYVTGTAAPGTTFEVGAVKANKGGSMTYQIPASGTLTKASGGFKDMFAYGSLRNADETEIVFKSGPITAAECPAAG